VVPIWELFCAAHRRSSHLGTMTLPISEARAVPTPLSRDHKFDKPIRRDKAGLRGVEPDFFESAQVGGWLGRASIAGRDEGPFFDPRTVAAQTEFQEVIGKFIELESQPTDALEQSLWT